MDIICWRREMSYCIESVSFSSNKRHDKITESMLSLHSPLGPSLVQIHPLSPTSTTAKDPPTTKELTTRPNNLNWLKILAPFSRLSFLFVCIYWVERAKNALLGQHNIQLLCVHIVAVAIRDVFFLRTVPVTIKLPFPKRKDTLTV